MGGNKGKVKPVRAQAPCFLCGKLTDKEDGDCAGCGKIICDSYECDKGNTPWGSHQPEDHRREADDDND